MGRGVNGLDDPTPDPISIVPLISVRPDVYKGENSVRHIQKIEFSFKGRKRLKQEENMNSSSPANSSVSTTAIVVGGVSATNAALEDFHFPSDLISIQDRKDEAMLVLKSDLMAALNEEVKSLDEDNWMYEGPRSRIHLISRPGGFLQKQTDLTKNQSIASPK